MNRKKFIQTGLGLGAGAVLSPYLPKQNTISSGWQSGMVNHIIPQVSHNRIFITLSTITPMLTPPILEIGKKRVVGERRDSQGQHWFFDIDGLESNQTYSLKLTGNSERLCDDWSIKTFPHPSSDVEKMRLLIYTCAGGHPMSRDFRKLLKESRQGFIDRRAALLKRGLSFNPDAVIAIGDQIYWDLEEVLPGIPGDGANEMAFEEVGKFDKSIPLLNTPNEEVLKKAVGPQVADLYKTHCRSTPVFMFNDDHDYFENDKATPSSITFPPRDFNLKLARLAQGLYWPEFLPDVNRPIGLSGSNAPDKARYSSESFGTLRYGKLTEILMYDCRRFTTLKGPSAGFIPRDAEEWLMKRVGAKDVLHTINVPSLPVGWSAGKWMEWYPDVLNKEGKLTKEIEKYFWQKGWQNQHDRILDYYSSQKHKKPVFFQGDLHAFGAGMIFKNHETDYSKNPIYAYLMGPLGSTAWPSGIRQVKATVPTDLGMEEHFEMWRSQAFQLLILRLMKSKSKCINI